MANKTVKDAKSIHGTNPQFLIEKIIRTRIYESRYWKEDCFALTADLVVDKGVELRYIGGIYGGNIKPTPFLCLTLKLLQLQPDKEIIIEFMQQTNFKYIRALGAFYFRLTGSSVEIYKYLEPLMEDYRKLRRCSKMGTFDAIYMDEFIDSLLREERVFDVILPRLTKRFVHEENGELLPRESKLSLELDNDDEENAEDEPEPEVKDVKKEEKKHSKDSKRKDDRSNRDVRRRRSSISPDDSRSRRRRSHSNDREDRYDPRDRRDYRDRYDRDDRDRRDRRRSSSRDRDRSHRRDRDYDDRKRDSRKERKDKNNKDDGAEKPKTEADEIAEMNALRAKLGLKPLKM